MPPCRGLGPAWAFPSSRPHPLLCAALPPSGACCALRVPSCAASLRGAAPARAARRCARPAAVPPGSLARPVCAATRLRGPRWPRLPSAPASRRCGLPVRSPLLCLALGLVQRVAPPGPPLAAPLRGLRGFPRPLASARRLRPRGQRGCAALRVLRPRGRVLRAAACGRLLGASAAAAAQIVGFSPAAPRPAPPAGGLPGA